MVLSVPLCVSAFLCASVLDETQSEVRRRGHGAEGGNAFALLCVSAFLCASVLNNNSRPTKGREGEPAVPPLLTARCAAHSLHPQAIHADGLPR